MLQRHGLLDRVREELLCDFQTHLMEMHGMTSQTASKSVSYIARMLHFTAKRDGLEAQRVQLRSVTIANVKAFLDAFQLCGALPSTRLSIVRCIRLFVRYRLVYMHQRGTIRDNFERLQEGLKDMARVIRRQLCERRADESFLAARGDTRQLTLRDVTAPVRAGRARALELSRVGGSMPRDDYAFFTGHLVSILLLSHGHRPSVACNLTCAEFRAGQTVESAYVVFVRRHKTGSSQPATFSLDEEEVALFRAYDGRVEETLCHWDLVKAREAFFSTYPNQGDSGFESRKHSNCSKVLAHYCRQLQVPAVTSTQARKAVETSATVNLSAAEQSLVERYLCHSKAVANRHYRNVTALSAARAGSLVRHLSSVSE